MKLFKRKKTDNTEEVSIQPPASSRIEVKTHKDANQKEVEKAKQANEHLNDLLIENGFTLKIFLAAHNPVVIKKR